jgi:hypothetical protein
LARPGRIKITVQLIIPIGSGLGVIELGIGVRCDFAVGAFVIRGSKLKEVPVPTPWY